MLTNAMLETLEGKALTLRFHLTGFHLLTIVLEIGMLEESFFFAGHQQLENFLTFEK